MKYKNKSENAVVFRAGKSADKPWEKKVYSVEAGATIEVQVAVTHGQLELVDEGEMTKSKKKIKGDE